MKNKYKGNTGFKSKFTGNPILVKKLEELLDCELPKKLMDCKDMMKDSNILIKIQEDTIKELNTYNIDCMFSYDNNSLQVLTSENNQIFVNAICSLILLKNGVSYYGWDNTNLIIAIAEQSLKIKNEKKNINI